MPAPDLARTAYAEGLPRAFAELAAAHPEWSPRGHRGYAVVSGPHAALLRPLPTDDGELSLCRFENPDQAPDPQWALAVAAIRLGGAERLVRQCVQHLSRRKIQGRMTLAHPVVRAHVADSVLDLAEARQCLGSPGFDHMVDGVVRRSLRQFGAAGYVDGPARRLARALDLLSDVYREGAGDDR
ncbi:acyl-CoA dehydrogenase family protein [Glycomyces sp. NPDC046736]|uniref:acyl-CoA dehydrogenase family protein n=1 Tax=Glycomyces sp. NPDC046736 TaxID=3155615 RepID=UPI00340BDC18